MASCYWFGDKLLILAIVFDNEDLAEFNNFAVITFELFPPFLLGIYVNYQTRN